VGRQRKTHVGEDLVILQYVFSLRVDARERKEFGRSNRPLAVGSDDAERRIERDERRGGIRRMDDVARTAAKDGVELVFPAGRETGVAAILEARKSVAEVPAPRPLADVAGQRPDIPDLRCPDALRGFGQDGEALPDGRFAAED